MDYITNLFPCITFIPAEVESPNYVTIYPGTYIPYTLYNIYPGAHIYHITNITCTPGTECASELGMRGGNQAMYLNSACFERGLIVPVHELMHTLGFVHEHNRAQVLAMSC